MPVEPSPQDARFSRVGGHLVLDLLNTVDWRLDPQRRGERLTDLARVLAWCRFMDVVSPDEHAHLTTLAGAHPRLAGREHRAVVHWRETVYDALITASPAAAGHVADRFRDALGRARLGPTADAWAWWDTGLTLTTPLDRIARATLDLFTDPRLRHLHQCEDEACGWVYLDTSPRHNRRWCVASDCGNRNRARQFYARHKADAGP
jgi:predicted RNA-binding Zn ribbon-like protein